MMRLETWIAVALVFAETVGSFLGGQVRSFGSELAMSGALRVISADDSSDPQLTLREAYGRHVAPSLEGLEPSTVAQYLTVIQLWEAFCLGHAITGSNGVTESTPIVRPVDQVYQITDAMLSDFARWLMAENPARTPTRYAVSTTETYAKKMTAIFNQLGPRSIGNPDASGVLEFVPAMSSVRRLLKGGELVYQKVDLTDDQIGAIYDACEIATWPDGDPVMQWRTYVVVLSMIAPRVDDGARLTSDNFKLQSRSPVAFSSRQSCYGWLDYEQDKTGKRVIIPLPRIVRCHVDAVMRARRHQSLFGWSSRKANRFSPQWKLIVAQAGLPHINPQHFRGTANLRWSLAAGDREVGEMILGHAAADVNSKHYTRKEAILLQHVDQVQFPPAFQFDLSRGPQQMFLF